MPNCMTLYHNPRSRASIAKWMLEEVGADYEVAAIDFEAGDNRKPEFLAINPMGKIPTLVLADGTVLTETAAIVAFLADAFPDKQLAPPLTASSRGIYYRWLFFAAAVFEPALTDTMMRKDAPPLPKSAVGWVTYDDVVDTIEAVLGRSDYLVGDRFTAADLYMGAQLWYAGSFCAPRIKESAVIQAYVARLAERDAYKRAMSG